MKIRIDFTTTEKAAIMNSCECTSDESAISKGSFGELKYNSKENFLEFNLKETFIIAICNLYGTYVNMIKGFINTFKIFESGWLTDSVTEFPNRPKEEESKTEADESQNA